MARTVQQIYNQILAQKDAETALAGLNSPSNVAIYKLWMWLTAVSQAFLEQVLDIYKADIETMIGKAGVGTLPWIRDRILEFQTGYNLTYSNGVLSYTTIDGSARIITRCSVTQSPDKVVTVKFAVSEPPEAATSLQLSEVEFYANALSFAGTQIRVSSVNPDLLYVLATIYYNGQLDPAAVQINVVAAMDAYTQNLSSTTNFNGSIIIDSIADAIQSAAGVRYIKLEEVGLRPNTADFSDRQILYSLSGGINIPIANTVSGYVIGETDPTHTFNDSFTYVPVS